MICIQVGVLLPCSVEGMRIRVRSGRRMKKQIRLKDEILIIESCSDCPFEDFRLESCILTDENIENNKKILKDCRLEDAG